jgi:WD40 repeat protein
VAFCGDGHFALSSSWDGTVRLWDVDKGKQERLWDFKSAIVRFTISPDGMRLALASPDGFIRLVEWQTGRLIRSWKAHPTTIWTLGYLPDGQRLLSGGEDRSIRLWDAEAGREVRQYPGHYGAVRDLQVFADGSRFLSTSQDGTLRIWPVEFTESNHSAAAEERARWGAEVLRLNSEWGRLFE